MNQPNNMERTNIIGEFINGKKQGKFEEYEYGRIRTICYYVDDELDGEYKEFYSNGKLSMHRNYVKGKIEGEDLGYFHSNEGDIGPLCKKSYYMNGILEGNSEIFYENNKLKFFNTFKNGKLDGESYEYYNNGQIKSTINYINGIVVGEEKQYYSNGQLSLICNHVINDNNSISTCEGPCIEYHNNGEVLAKYNFVNDKIHGEYEAFDEQGDLIEYSNYVNGVKQPENI